MASIFAELNKGIREGVTLIVEKTGSVTRNIKHNIDVLGLKREVERLFYELGGRTFELLSHEPPADIAADPEVQELYQKLRELDEQLAAREAESASPKTDPPGSL